MKYSFIVLTAVFGLALAAPEWQKLDGEKAQALVAKALEVLNQASAEDYLIKSVELSEAKSQKQTASLGYFTTRYWLDFTAAATTCTKSSTSPKEAEKCETDSEKPQQNCHADIWEKPWGDISKVSAYCTSA